MLLLRTTTLLAAVLMTVIQPALARCACSSCEGVCATHSASAGTQKAAAKPSCCNLAKSESQSCCGASAGACSCGSRGDSGSPSSQAAFGGQRCSCSAPSDSIATASPTVQIDHALSVHHWLAAPRTAGVHEVSSAAIGAIAAECGSPPRFGGLRMHAFLGVWIV